MAPRCFGSLPPSRQPSAAADSLEVVWKKVIWTWALRPNGFETIVPSRKPTAASDSLDLRLLTAPPPAPGMEELWQLTKEDIRLAASAAKALENDNVTAYAAISAARTLGQLGGGAASYAGLLARKLGDQRDDVRQTVAWALVQLGASAVAPHAHVVVDFLGDQLIMALLSHVLSATGATGAEALARKVAEKDSPSSQRAAVQVLKSMGSDAADALANHLGDQDPKARSQIVIALSQLGEAAAPHVDDLASLLDDPDPEVKAAAAEAIGSIGKVAGQYAGALADLLQHRNRLVRLKAVTALGCLGDAATPYTDPVARALEDLDAHVQRAALISLGQIGEASIDHDPLKHFDADAWKIPDSGKAALAQHLMNHKVCSLEMILNALQKMGATGAAIITTQLIEKDSHLRNHCVEALLQMAPKHMEVNVGAAAIASQLDHENAKFRIWLCGAIGRGCSDARGQALALKNVWENDPDEFVQNAAKKAISKMGAKTGCMINVLLNAPEIVASSVPSRESDSANEMTEILKNEVERIRVLLNQSRGRGWAKGSRSKSASTRSCCLAVCRKLNNLPTAPYYLE